MFKDDLNLETRFYNEIFKPYLNSRGNDSIFIHFNSNSVVYESLQKKHDIDIIMKKTKALIPESPILVLPSLAKQIGLNEAIILQQMHYWLLDSKHIHDDKPWIYNSYASWQRTNFPFWSINTIKRTILNLEKMGIIESGNFNKLKIDRTKWYTINYEKIPDIHPPLAQNEPIRVSKRANQEINMSPPLPEITTETTTEKDIYSRFDEIFDFWNKQSVLPTHNRFTLEKKIKKEHMDIIVNYSIQTVIESIELYVKVLESNKHFFNYKWTLWDFLKRGIDKFLPDADPLNNFLITKINKDDTRKSREERLKETERISKEVFGEQ